jgi:hypothetical protein
VLDRAYLFSRICLMARGMLVYFGYSGGAPAYFGLDNLLEVYRLLESPSFIPVNYTGQAKYEPPAPGSPGDLAAAARTAVRNQPKKEAPEGSVSRAGYEMGATFLCRSSEARNLVNTGIRFTPLRPDSQGSPSHLDELIAEAFLIASTGRPGPVLIDVPKDVGTEQFDYLPVEPGSAIPAGFQLPPSPSAAALAKAT